jgi:hypothetical protein
MIRNDLSPTLLLEMTPFGISVQVGSNAVSDHSQQKFAN